MTNPSSRQTFKLSVNRKLVASIGNKPSKEDVSIHLTHLENVEMDVARIAGIIDNGFSFSSQFRDGKRDKEHFLSSQFIGADFDHPSPEARELPIIKAATILYNTPSATPEEPRFRAIWLLEEPITDPDYYERAKKGLQWILEEHGTDGSTVDAARFFFGCKDSNPEVNPGNTMTVAQVAELVAHYNRALEVEKEIAAAKVTFDFTPHRGNGGKEKYFSKVVDTMCNKISAAQKGSRHPTALCVAKVIGGYIAGEGFDSRIENEAIDRLITAYTSSSDRPIKQVKSVINAGIKDGKGKKGAIHIPDKEPWRPPEPINFTDKLKNATEKARANTPKPEDNNPVADGSKSGSKPEDATKEEQRDKKLWKRAELSHFPKPVWLIEGELQRNSLATIVGESGCGKTFQALAMALRTAQTENVVYIAGEAPEGYEQRIAAWEEYHQTGPTSNFYLWSEPLQISEPSAIAEFLVAIEPLKSALIVADTLARCAVGLDENSAKDMGLFVAGLDWVRKQTGACILTVHHTTKSGGTERGSGAFKGAMDTQIKMTVEGEVRKITFEKQKNAASGEPRFVELKPVGSSLVAIGSNQENATSDRITGKNKEVLEVLSSEMFATTGAKWARLQDALGWDVTPSSKSQLFKILTRLLKKGYITQGAKGDPYTITKAGRDMLGVQDMTFATSSNFGSKQSSATKPDEEDIEECAAPVNW